MQPRARHLIDDAIRQSHEIAELDTKIDIDNLLKRNLVSLSQSDLTSSGENSANEDFSFYHLPKDTLSSQPLLSREGRESYAANDGAGVNFAPGQSSRVNGLHSPSSTCLLLRVSYILLKYIGAGFQWIFKFITLGLYSFFLLPGFVQIGWYYFFSPHVQHNIAYGEGRRNRLDLYIPSKLNKQKPAIAFVTGGAWIIGYKAWGSLLAQELVERDVIVACIDYRNFPQTGVSGMVEDITQGINFFCNNIHKYGGDPNRLYLAGQSAGAHLAACALVEQAKREVSQETDSLTWRTSQLKTFFGISGGYNLPALSKHFHTRGFYQSFFLRVMEGEESLQRYSPELVLRSPDFQNAAHMFPETILMHGTEDYSIPFKASVDFADALRSVHVQVKTKLYPEKTHTDLFLQDPMRGGKDQLVADILAVLHANDIDAELNDAGAPLRRRMVPECLLQLARKVSPF